MIHHISPILTALTTPHFREFSKPGFSFSWFLILLKFFIFFKFLTFCHDVEIEDMAMLVGLWEIWWAWKSVRIWGLWWVWETLHWFIAPSKIIILFSTSLCAHFCRTEFGTVLLLNCWACLDMQFEAKLPFWLMLKL